jgi:hypothetical protein
MYRQQANQNSFATGFSNQAFTRTTSSTSRKRAPTALQRTELSQYKVENFRALADQNIDLKSAKVIPLDDVSVEEAHKFQGEIKTINLQPIEVRQTILPSKALIDRSLQMSEKEIADDVAFEQRMPQERMLQRTQAPEPDIAPAQKIMVKDVIKRTHAPDLDSLNEFAMDKGLDWRACCGIFAALLFIIGMAALLKYFLFVPVVAVPPPPPQIVTVYTPAPVPVPAPAPVAKAAVAAAAAHSAITRIEHVKIRKKVHGKGHSTRHVVTHDSTTGKTTHTVHRTKDEGNSAEASQAVQGFQSSAGPLPIMPVNGVVLAQPPVTYQPIPVQPVVTQNFGQMPPPMIMDSGMQFQGQMISQPADYGIGYGERMEVIGQLPSQQESSQLLIADGQIQPLASLEPLNGLAGLQQASANQVESAMTENGLQFLSQTTSIDQPLAQPVPVIKAPEPQPAGKITIEFEMTEEPQTSQVTLESKPIHVATHKSMKIEATHGVRAQAVRRVKAQAIHAAKTLCRRNKISVVRVHRNSPLAIPHTVVLPDQSVINKTVRIVPNRHLKKTSKIDPRRRHDFDEMDITHHNPAPHSPNDFLNASVRGDRSNEPYSHMNDFMGITAGPADKNASDDFGITYKFRNAGAAFADKAAKEPVQIKPLSGKVLVIVRSGK